ncbi:hypothetical protein B5807_06464 [Epicoccum nigrum]|uniref:C2H2-type domain-containing protein n=1 Tax=Epicoccum nigrum TaxID=105696 RepID=A0A1Y2LW99_EPING|nr:hypothetical protein B5807_06464 [Epicoccum nigrum]
MMQKSSGVKRPKKRVRDPDDSTSDVQIAKRPGTKENPSVDRNYYCEPCQLTYQSHSTFYLHRIQEHNDGFPNKCPLLSCTDHTTYTCFADLDTHITIDHVRALHQRNAQSRIDHLCRFPECDMRFQQAETLDVYKSHLLTRHCGWRSAAIRTTRRPPPLSLP